MATDPMHILLLGAGLGFFGQGVRAAVGLKTLADYANGPAPSESDVFNAARLLISLVIGTLAGIASAISYYALLQGNIGDIGVAQVLGFAGAGYVGTDIIEAFIVKFFDQTSPTGLKNSTAPSGAMSMDAFASSLDTFAAIQQKLPNLAQTPTLTTRGILNYLKSKVYPPKDPAAWKATDPIKPNPLEDTPDYLLNKIQSLFQMQRLPKWELNYDDERLLKTDSYQNLALSIGQLFKNHGGDYVA
jgi:hypothetical protein